MSVTSDHVEETVTAYLGKRPDQREQLAPPLDLPATGAGLTGRQILGHVTVSGLCFRSDGKIAQAALRVPGVDVGGVEHRHFDMRFRLETDADFGELPAEEVGDAFWSDPAELVDASLLETVALMNGASS